VVFVLVCASSFVGVDAVAAQDLVGAFADDGDGFGGDEDQYRSVGVGDAGAVGDELFTQQMCWGDGP
jgi:hypothetical protein